jgi:hypothetical protein
MFNNCCCSGPCDGTCVIHSDKFDRADSGTIGARWTENAGAWEIKDNTLYTEDSSAKVSWDPDQFSSFSDGRSLVARIRGEDDGDEISVWWASSYYFKVTIGTPGNIQIYDSADLLYYETDYALAPAEWHTLKIVMGTNTYGNYTGVFIDNTCAMSVYMNAGEIEETAIETGTVGTSVAVDFICINSSDSQVGGCATGMNLPWITNNDTPRTITITIAGAINNGTVDYTGLNGTYVFNNYPLSGTNYNIPDIPVDGDLVDQVDFVLPGTTGALGDNYYSPKFSFGTSGAGDDVYVYRQTYGNTTTPPATNSFRIFPSQQSGFSTDTITLIAATADTGTCTVVYS